MTNTVGNTLTVRDYQRMLKTFRKDPIWGSTSKYHKNLVMKSVCKDLDKNLKISYSDSRWSIYLEVLSVLGNKSTSVYNIIDLFGPKNGEESPELFCRAVAMRVAFTAHRFLGTV